MQNSYDDKISDDISHLGPESARRQGAIVQDYDKIIGTSSNSSDQQVVALDSVIESPPQYSASSFIADLSQVTQEEPDIVSIISHELLSPVTLIKGYTATLLQMGDKIAEEEKEQYIRNIESAANKLTGLLENIRDIGYFESGGFNILVKPTSLTRLLWETVSEFQNQTSKHVIKLRIIRPLPRLNIDRQKIVIVISNLLSNAIKYSPQGGNIHVIVGRSEKKELEEIFRTACPARTDCVTVSITDSGSGIANNELESIFKKFYRINNRLAQVTSGAGLGLYICKTIVEAHGGRIWATSQPGVGSTFSFTLPL